MDISARVRGCSGGWSCGVTWATYRGAATAVLRAVRDPAAFYLERDLFVRHGGLAKRCDG